MSGLRIWAIVPAVHAPSAPPSLLSRRVVETCLVFATFLLPGYLSSVAEVAPSIPSVLPSVLLTALPQIAFILYLLEIQGDRTRPEMGLGRPVPRDVLEGGLLLVAMLLLLAAVEGASMLLPEAAREGLKRGARFRLAGWNELPAAFLFCFVAAAREEIFYRAYLTARLGDLGLPLPGALLASSALFAAAHLYQGYLAVAIAFAQGLLLGGVFAKAGAGRRSIAVPVVAHACHNLVVLALTLLPG